MIQAKAQQHYPSLQKQRGATLIGMAFVAAILVFAAIVAMKMVPAYIEFMSVKQVLKAMEQESLRDMSKKEIMTSFDKRASTAYIEVVKGSDLIIAKREDGTTGLSVQYQVVKPIIANISVVLDFDASSDAK